jgi:hypothetical protein
MSATKSLVGQPFGRLRVISRDGSHPTQKRAQWRCSCSCGSTHVATTDGLKSGDTTSCGCLKAEKTAELKRSHGLAASDEYRIWCNIKSRCQNRKNESFKDYGARGIALAVVWQSFETFYRDMGARPSKRHTIERKNNALGYAPDNCVWATKAQQNRNKRSTRHLTHAGETLCVTDWAAKLKLPANTLFSRLHNGWSTEETLLTPKGKKRRKT